MYFNYGASGNKPVSGAELPERIRPGVGLVFASPMW
jgi:hypothetical protein